MTLTPLNDRIKVQRIADPHAPKHLIYQVPDSVREGPQYARVVAIPKGAFPPGNDISSIPLRQGIEVDSTVVLGANVGICIPEDGQDYYYVLPGDFLAVVG